MNMKQREDAWTLDGLTRLSDRAWIRMVSRLFRVEYQDDEPVVKEWKKGGTPTVRLSIGCGERYEFRIRRFPGCTQIQAEALGGLYCHGNMALEEATRLKDPGISYFGKNAEAEYCTALEFSGRERVELSFKVMTLGDRSAWQMEAAGFLLFLPFLAGEPQGRELQEEDPLKSYAIHDIICTLNLSLKKGDLTIFDVQKLKQLCRQSIRRTLGRERRAQNLESQERILNAFETDFGQLEQMLSEAGQTSE